MAPRFKDATWKHVDMIDGFMYCKYCKKLIKGGGIFRIKEHLAGIGGQVLPCDAPNEEIGQIRMEMLDRLRNLKKRRLGKRT